jgi:hypothetical protein
MKRKKKVADKASSLLPRGAVSTEAAVPLEPAPSVNNAAAARLAAFGEAFLESIDAAPVRGSTALRASPRLTAADATASRATRKKKRKAGNRVGLVGTKSLDGNGGSAAKPGSMQSISVATPLAAPGLRQTHPTAQQAEHVMAVPRKVSAAERRRFMSGKVSDIHGKASTLEGRGRNGRDREEEREFNKTLREVLDFVTPQLGKQERRQFEEQKIRALGGTLEKRQKMPYQKLQADRKQADVTRKRKVEEEKTLGVSMSVNKHRKQWAVDRLQKQKKEEIKDKKRRREDGLLRLGLGARESRGMAIIPQKALKKFNI